MRLALTVVLLGALAAPAAAQEAAPAPAPGLPAEPDLDRAWNVLIATGAGSVVEFTDGLAGGLIQGLSGYQQQVTGRKQLNLRVDRTLSRWLRVGGAYVYTGWTTDLSTGGVRAGTVDSAVQCLLADVTLRWSRGEHWELTSGLALGGGVWTEEAQVSGQSSRASSAGVAFQARLIGVAFGFEHVRAYVELGLGFEGLLVGGLAVRF
jgi:hypothetical protein